MNINYPLLLDGGLSNELEAQGCDLNHPLWSARLLGKNPEAITQAHLSYLKAGARCIITSSYQASMPGLLANGYSRSAAETLLLLTVQLAEKAVQDFMETDVSGHKPLIAASIGPYGACLADGSEYNGEYGVSDDELKEFHISRLQLLDASNADLFACETIPSVREAEVLSEILMETRKMAWISFACRDEQHLNDGTPIEECVALFAKHPNILAIGVNCTAPEHISGLIQRIQEQSGEKKIVIYPNSGEVYDAESKTWSDTTVPVAFRAMNKEWLRLGADIIGGCCRIGPNQIATLHKLLEEIN